MTAIRRDDQEALSEKGVTLQREEEISLNSKGKTKNDCSSTTADRMASGVTWTRTEQTDIMRSKSRTIGGKTRNWYSGRKW